MIMIFLLYSKFKYKTQNNHKFDKWCLPTKKINITMLPYY